MSVLGHRAGIIQIDVEMIGTLLHLPEGHTVRDLRMSHNPFVGEIVVEGPRLPLTPLGDCLPNVNYSVNVGSACGEFK